MGKRRDRRKAAMSNSGRRHRLDLFAEPSGDLGGSSEHDGLGEGLDSSKRSDGLPNSPSSSGQQPENPLMLLGQYSDDEENNQSSKSHEHANGDTSITDHIDQGLLGLDQGSHVAGRLTVDEHANRLVETSCAAGSDKLDAGVVDDDAQEAKEDTLQDSDFLKDMQEVDGCNHKDRETNAPSDMPKEVSQEQQDHVGISNAQVASDVDSCWKMVLHEESNRYYYWNMVTGETSWELPVALSQLATPSSDSMYATAAAGSSNLLTQTENLSEFGVPVDRSNEIPESSHPVVFPCSGDASRQLEHVMQYPMETEIYKAEMDHCSHLIKLGEDLLQKLNSLRSGSGLPCDQEWIFKSGVEVEIRLSDMKSLSSNGPSLQPFWMYIEGRLRYLEAVLDCKVGQINNLALNDSEVPRDSVAKEDSGAQIIAESKSEPGDATKDAFSAPETIHSSPGMNPVIEAGPVAQTVDTVLPPIGSDGSGDDVDMDVDMEVDDATVEGHNVIVQKSCEETVFVTEDSVKLKQPALASSVALDEGSPVPPPPDEDWVPPLPPDSEQIPPPPPDEPEPSYPVPPVTEVGQPLPYGDQYNMSYQNSIYDIYGHSGVAHSNFYGHADGQVLVPQGPVSYGYPGSVPVVTNPEPMAYYNIQNATGPSPVVAASAAGSTLDQIQPDPVTYSGITSVQVGAGHGNLLSLSSVEPLDARGEAGNGHMELTSTSAPTGSAPVEAPVVTSPRDGISEPSVSAPAVSAASTQTNLKEAKVQSKVLRTKKRTVAVAPSLRSNKKVSSLVDKWKAAKEELQEDEEDEAKTALANLERKRQREIEEWHAQQIASGEAKDNANFQPLGGDWRERVKRKRAQANKEAAASATEELSNGNKKPDLGDLSKDLPPGWQAYWDESSKQVYYGNPITSETSWIRPSK